MKPRKKKSLPKVQPRLPPFQKEKKRKRKEERPQPRLRPLPRTQRPG
jgi:hypothetical protein